MVVIIARRQTVQVAPSARITRGPEAFVQWVTQRGMWEALGVHAEGDRSMQEIARQFRVF